MNSLFRHRFQYRQKIMNSIDESSQKVSLKISQIKIMVLRINNNQKEFLRIGERLIENVGTFSYFRNKIREAGKKAGIRRMNKTSFHKPEIRFGIHGQICQNKALHIQLQCECYLAVWIQNMKNHYL